MRQHHHPVIPIAPESDADAHADAEAGPTRREALGWMAASLALAGGGCVKSPDAKVYPYVDLPEAGHAGALPAYYATAWVRDGWAHGVLVGTRDGRPIKVEGNPRHPAGRGGSDAAMQASVLELWDPDRSQQVARRIPARSASGAASAAQAPSTWGAFDSAWRERAAALDRSRGASLALLLPAFTSDSLGRAVAALLDRFPAARWVQHAPQAPARARQGAQLAFGRTLGWRCHFDRARAIVAFGCDPFSDGPAALQQAADWAAARAGVGVGERARGVDAPVCIAVETTPGLFGARADLRAALAPAAIESLLDAVVAGVDARLGGAAPGAGAGLADRIADALHRAGAAALVVVGETLSPRAHAQAAALLQRLGAIGRTVEAIAPPDAPAGRVPASLAELVAAIDAGSVDTLLIVDANPVYDAPGDVAFARALDRVGFSARLGLYRDETSRRCGWHLPASHVYEQWGDARAADGSASIVQPAIAPLYDTRSPLRWLAGLADPAAAGSHDDHAWVRATWRGQRGDADFDAWWTGVLRAGVIDGSAAAALALPRARAIAPAPPAAAPAAIELELVLGSDPAGAPANNAWLHELPRPLTRMTWGNALVVGPQTAARLGLDSGRVARVRAASGATVEAPVWVQSAHAEGAATLALGYGRTAAGRVGNGIGADGQPLRRADGAPVAVTVEPTRRRHDFALAQVRIDQAGRDLAKSVAAGAALPAAAPQPSLYPERSFPEHAWAMAIDLDACIGCGACTVACQAENNIPVVGADEVRRGRAMHWIRVDHYEADDAAPDGHADAAFQPVPCMHCENAPCEVVCPVGATVHDSEGLNLQVYNRCVGTRFCSNNCPYKVRRFNFLAYNDPQTETLKAMRNPDVTVRRRGVMEKCTYCVQRIARARVTSQTDGTPIADGAVVSACQAACPTHAIHFGDANDPAADIVRARASPRHYALLDELNTRPRTTYLARVRKERT